MREIHLLLVREGVWRSDANDDATAWLADFWGIVAENKVSVGVVEEEWMDGWKDE